MKFSRGFFFSFFAIWLLLMIAVFAGCQSDEVASCAPETFEGWSYVMAGVATMDNQPIPDEQDEPSSDVCSTCNGTGRVGDGRVSVVCQDCAGDGKAGQSKSPVVEPVKANVTSSYQSGYICDVNGCRPVSGTTPVSYSQTYSQGSGYICDENGCRPSGVVGSNRILSGRRLLGRFR